MNPVLIKTTANLYEDCLHLKLYQFIYTKIFVDLYDYRPTSENHNLQASRIINIFLLL